MTSAADIGAARWNALANPAGVAQPHPFTTFEFFDALEASGSATADTGWQPCHLIIDDPPPPHGGGGSLGIMPLYLKSHSYGEYVFDHAWAEALERAGGDYYPKLQCSVPFTPVTGPRLLAKTEGGHANYLYGDSLDRAEMIRVEGAPAQYAMALAPLLPAPGEESQQAPLSALLLARFALACTQAGSDMDACRGDVAARARRLVDAVPPGHAYRLPAVTALESGMK